MKFFKSVFALSTIFFFSCTLNAADSQNLAPIIEEPSTTLDAQEENKQATQDPTPKSPASKIMNDLLACNCEEFVNSIQLGYSYVSSEIQKVICKRSVKMSPKQKDADKKED